MTTYWSGEQEHSLLAAREGEQNLAKANAELERLGGELEETRQLVRETGDGLEGNATDAEASARQQKQIGVLQEDAARLLETGKRLSRALTEATARGDALQARVDQAEAAGGWINGSNAPLTTLAGHKAAEANLDESQGKATSIQALSREVEAGGNDARGEAAASCSLVAASAGLTSLPVPQVEPKAEGLRLQGACCRRRCGTWRVWPAGWRRSASVFAAWRPR